MGGVLKGFLGVLLPCGLLAGGAAQAATAPKIGQPAPVFSATDSQGNHYWRVYPVSGGLGTVGLPPIPSPSTKKGKP